MSALSLSTGQKLEKSIGWESHRLITTYKTPTLELNALRERNQPHLGWHAARPLFVAVFVITLFRAGTINLSELAVAFPGRAKSESQYKRQQRFFRAFELAF